MTIRLITQYGHVSLLHAMQIAFVPFDRWDNKPLTGRFVGMYVDNQADSLATLGQWRERSARWRTWARRELRRALGRHIEFS